LGKCKHKQRVYKIELLYPTLEFDERLVISSECENCGRFILVLKFYYTGTRRYWSRKYGREVAKEKYESLIPDIMCDYSVNLHPELDLGLNYFEGKDCTIRKVRNSAKVNYFIPNEVIFMWAFLLYRQKRK
jgi:hypothetical protein